MLPYYEPEDAKPREPLTYIPVNVEYLSLRLRQKMKRGTYLMHFVSSFGPKLVKQVFLR
jgi:hypothetical protein